jgi:membrane glycosyltransferase
MNSTEANETMDSAAVERMAAAESGGAELTPAGLQSLPELARRRWIVIGLNTGLYACLALWLTTILGAGGWGPLELVFFACFLIASPWAVLGFINAALGLWLLRFSPDGLARVAPFLEAAKSTAPLRLRVALAMTVRNEDPGRALGRLRRMQEELSLTADAAQFSFHVLSDTFDTAIAAEEQRLVAAWRAERPEAAARIHYRLRADNFGFKAGNLHEFCAQSARRRPPVSITGCAPTISGSRPAICMSSAREAPATTMHSSRSMRIVSCEAIQ